MAGLARATRTTFMPSIPPERDDLLLGVVVEGVTDFFFGRPLDENPYARDFEPAWSSWRCGWLEGSFFEQLRGADERRRWAT